MSELSRVLYVIACATPAARDVAKLVALAQERGWRVCVIATSSALADMQGAGRVIEAAHDIPAGDLVRLPRERRASHLLDVSRGYLQAGQRDEAATTLLDADRLAREEVRCRDLTRQIITDLVRSYPRGTRPLSAVTQLARAVGITV